MTEVLLGLGSNIDARENLPAGLGELGALFGTVECSPVYEGAAIGFAGDPFTNLVVSAQTELRVGELQRTLRNIEFAHGRPQNAERCSPRTLDIDILLFGDASGLVDGIELPRREILQHAFVLRPLSDLRPAMRHPVDGRSFAELWNAFDQEAQPLRPVSLLV
ncbi:MAG: 2-amino-4-hydroxy-6-hydroxymethyldihydropteridine diphosphokinase [Pseudomonadota bacterium]